MPEHFKPEDNQNDDSDYHKQARTQSEEPIYTTDDKDFTVDEITNAVASMGNKRHQERWDNWRNLQSTIEILPRYITAIYKSCIRRRNFPTRWKITKIIPISKARKGNRKDISKFHPVTFLNIGGNFSPKL